MKIEKRAMMVMTQRQQQAIKGTELYNRMKWFEQKKMKSKKIKRCGKKTGNVESRINSNTF